MTSSPDNRSVILGGSAAAPAPSAAAANTASFPHGEDREPDPTREKREPNEEGNLMSLPIGTILADRYEILGELGSGGFGIVYEARDREYAEDIVAIKEYIPEMCYRHPGSHTVAPKTRKDREAFEKGLEASVAEARALSVLDHPNIVRVSHWFRQFGTVYIVMRRLLGQTLESAIKKGDRLQGDAAVSMMKDLLSALAVIHGKGLLHRDISPSNILVLNGSPTLIDFGAARVAVGKESHRLTAIARHGYTPWEQYDDYGIERQTAATDFYALGATLYHAITLNKPISSITLKRESDRVRPVSEQGAGYLPAHVLATIDKALKIDQGERWQSAAAWAEAIDAAPKGPKRRMWPYVVGGLFLLYIFFNVGF